MPVLPSWNNSFNKMASPLAGMGRAPGGMRSSGGGAAGGMDTTLAVGEEGGMGKMPGVTLPMPGQPGAPGMPGAPGAGGIGGGGGMDTTMAVGEAGGGTGGPITGGGGGMATTQAVGEEGGAGGGAATMAMGETGGRSFTGLARGPLGLAPGDGGRFEGGSGGGGGATQQAVVPPGVDVPAGGRSAAAPGANVTNPYAMSGAGAAAPGANVNNPYAMVGDKQIAGGRNVTPGAGVDRGALTTGLQGQILPGYVNREMQPYINSRATRDFNAQADANRQVTEAQQFADQQAFRQRFARGGDMTRMTEQDMRKAAQGDRPLLKSDLALWRKMANDPNWMPSRPGMTDWERNQEAQAWGRLSEERRAFLRGRGGTAAGSTGGQVSGAPEGEAAGGGVTTMAMNESGAVLGEGAVPGPGKPLDNLYGFGKGQVQPPPTSDDYILAQGGPGITTAQQGAAKGRIARWKEQNPGATKGPAEVAGGGSSAGQVAAAGGGQVMDTPFVAGGAVTGGNQGTGGSGTTPGGQGYSWWFPSTMGNWQPYYDEGQSKWNFYQQLADAWRYGQAGGLRGGFDSNDQSGGQQTGAGAAGRSFGQMLVDAYNQAFNANKARETELRGRYNKAETELPAWLAGQVEGLNTQYANRLQTGMGMLEGYGDQMIKDTQDAGKQLEGSQDQALVNSGLYNTTVRGNMKQGAFRRTQDAVGAIKDMIAGRKTSLYAGLSGEQLSAAQGLMGLLYGAKDSLQQRGSDFIERINNLYPDLAKYLGLATQAGTGAGSQVPPMFFMGGGSDPGAEMGGGGGTTVVNTMEEGGPGGPGTITTTPNLETGNGGGGGGGGGKTVQSYSDTGGGGGVSTMAMGEEGGIGGGGGGGGGNTQTIPSVIYESGGGGGGITSMIPGPWEAGGGGGKTVQSYSDTGGSGGTTMAAGPGETGGGATTTVTNEEGGPVTVVSGEAGYMGADQPTFAGFDYETGGGTTYVGYQYEEGGGGR